MQVQIQQQKQQNFVSAFISCTIDRQANYAKYAYNYGNVGHRIGHHAHDYFITNVKIISSSCIQPEQEHYSLGDGFFLLVQRDYEQKPIIDIGNFQSLPEGWRPIEIDNGPDDDGWRKGERKKERAGLICVRNGVVGTGAIYTVQIMDGVQDEKTEETTQPSLGQKSQLLHSYVKIQIGTFKRYLNFVKKSQLQISNLRFKPQVESMFQQRKGYLDLPNLAILCFPEGVKISKKQSGFKFFTFILTTDCAQRFYCNSIIFSQKCSPALSQILHQKYGLRSPRGLFTQKLFTLISSHSSTESVSKLLQHLYRIYLSQSPSLFNQKITTLSSDFTYNPSTKTASYSSSSSSYILPCPSPTKLIKSPPTQPQHPSSSSCLFSSTASTSSPNFSLNFRIPVSYPQVSTNAIYGVFKFLQIEQIVAVIEGLLIERKIFFISDCEAITGMAIQAFVGFLYPMNWIHGIINPLPSSMIQYTEAPMAIIFGLRNQLVQNMKADVDGVFVFLDRNKVQLRNCTQMSFLPNLRKQLINRLKQFSVYDKIDVRDYLNNTENLSLFKTQSTQDPNFDAYKIRNIFFQLTVFILRNYKQYFHKTFKKQTEQSNKGFGGLKKYYDLDGLLHFYRKDPLLSAFFQTSLFSVLVQKKKQQPNNKWIKTLDRAIKKITQCKKQLYIKQQSDNQSDTNQLFEQPQQQQEHDIPKGCLNLINFTSRSSEDEKTKSSSSQSQSPSPKSYKQSRYFKEDLRFHSPISPTIGSSSKVHGRMSLPNQYEIKQNATMLEGKTNQGKDDGMYSDKNQKSDKSDKSARSQKSEKLKSQKDQGQTDKSSSCGKSQPQIPQLRDNHQIIVYQFDLQNQNQNSPEEKGVSSVFCQIFSYPYKKVTNSVVSRWTKKKLNKFKNWRKKNKNIQMVEQKIQKQQQKKQSQPCQYMTKSV